MRTERDAPSLRHLAQGLADAAAALLGAAGELEESGAPYALLHADTAFNSLAPRMIDWCHRSAAEIRAQSHAYKAGLANQAEATVERHRKYGKPKK